MIFILIRLLAFLVILLPLEAMATPTCLTVDGGTYAKTSAGIQQAIDACTGATCVCVYLTSGTYVISSRMTPHSNLAIEGAGKGQTVLQGNVSGDWVMEYSSTTNQLQNFSLTNMTFDLQNGANDSGLQIDNSNNVIIANVEWLNGASQGWFLYFGIPTTVANGATNTIYNTNIIVLNNDFTNHAGSLESFLIFNTRYAQIINPTFTNNSSPSLGIWQQDYDIAIMNASCLNSSSTQGVVYYSISTFRLVIQDAHSTNCGPLVMGANISDWGLFGLTQANDISIINPTAIGGVNSGLTWAIQLGAVNNVTVINPFITGYAIGVLFNKGNNGANALTTNWAILGGTIQNGNPTAVANVLNPGIFFNQIGGNMYGSIQGVTFQDTQGTPTQVYPISFDGAFAWDKILIQNNVLHAYTGGVSVGLADGASLSGNVFITCNTSYTAGPTQATCN